MFQMPSLRDVLADTDGEQEIAAAAFGRRDPWSYSSEDGLLVQNGKIRVYGFSTPLNEPLGIPRVARRTPAVLTLKPGRYSWCTCGHSKQQPFCDNSHRALEDGAPWRSYKFAVLEQTDVTLCRCKRTQDPPFCDCQHESVI
jgi:CDGSH-type Zn-finger protein